MSVTMNNEGPGFVALPPVPEGAVMVTLKIRRFNPEDPGKAGWVSFEVPCLPTDRLLNLLTYVKGYLDGTLTFRRSCAHGVCGSDAMVINGVNRLACKVLMRDMPNKDGKNTTVTIAPLKGLPVEKDLVVDMEPFFSAYRQIKPFLMTSGQEPTRERTQSQADRARYDDTTKCILCACCTESCPVYWADGSYFGPAAIVNAHRFIFDSRDEGAGERMDILGRHRRRLALPHHLQLHRRLSARNQGDASDHRSQTRVAVQPQGSNAVAARVLHRQALNRGLRPWSGNEKVSPCCFPDRLTDAVG